MFTRRPGPRRAATFVLIPAAILATVATVAVAGCGAANSPGTAPASHSPPASTAPAPSSPAPVLPGRPISGPVPVVPEKTDCTGWPAAPEGALRQSFVPAAALRCTTGYTTVPGKGTWLTATLERAEENLMPLADALRAASGHMRPGEICPQFVIRPPEIVMIGTDGTMIRPRFPVTACGQIQQQVLAALDALRWRTVSQRLIEKAPAPAHS